MSPGPTEVFQVVPGDGETAILACSAKGKRSFDYYHVLQPFPATKLFIRDPENNWYNAGIGDFGMTVDEIADRLCAEIARMRGSRVIVLGSSMGAYAAILFGCKVGADRVIALGPQTVLDPMFSLTPPPEVELQAPDLEPVVAAAPGTAVDVVVGWDDLVDVFYATRLAHLPSVRVIGLRDESHTFVSSIHSRDQLVPLFKGLMEGRVPDFCDTPELTPETRAAVVESVLAFHRREYALAAELIEPVTRKDPRWSGAHFLLGKAWAYAGDQAAAERAHTAAVEANPAWYEPYRHLGQAMLAQDRAAEAEAPLAKSVEMSPQWTQARFYYAECLHRLDRPREAREEFERAVELDTGWGEPAARLEELYGPA